MIWRSLRPTGAQLLGIGLFITLRLAAWLARSAFDRPDIHLSHAAAGLLYDAMLVTSLFWFGRALAMAEARLRRLRRLRLLIPSLLGGSALLLRCIDLGHCYMAQCHWAPEAFLYLNTDFAGALSEPRFLAAILVALGFLLGLPWLFRRDQHKTAHPSSSTTLPHSSTAIPHSSTTIPLVGAIMLSALPVYDAIHAPEDIFNLRLIPELNFAVQAHTWLHADERLRTVKPLTATQRTTFHAAGLLHSFTPVLPGFPLVRRGLGEPPFPHPAPHPMSSSEQRPNVVLAVVESLDALFIHELSGAYAGVMPELSALAKNNTVVKQFFNTATPTVSALIAILCSIHPPTYPKDLEAGRDGLAAYTCLSDLLHFAGYRTVFIQGTPASMTGINNFLRLHGFDEIHDKTDIEQRFPASIMGKWGAHDQTLLRYVKEQITRLEKLKAVDHKPYLLLFMTIDTHDPGMAAQDCVLPTKADGALAVTDAPTGSGARTLLASYHCTDRVLGDFFRFLAEPKRAQQTLWLLTGDHAAFRTLNSKALFENHDTGWSFAALPLILHDPRHILPHHIPVLSGTLDIAPTVLHMLGLQIGLHSLTGLSIFGARRELPFLLGRIGGHIAYVHTPQARRELSVSELRQSCQNNDPLLSEGPNPMSACDVLRWVEWQDELWHARRLFPRTLYWGQELDIP